MFRNLSTTDSAVIDHLGAALPDNDGEGWVEFSDLVAALDAHAPADIEDSIQVLEANGIVKRYRTFSDGGGLLRLTPAGLEQYFEGTLGSDAFAAVVEQVWVGSKPFIESGDITSVGQVAASLQLSTQLLLAAVSRLGSRGLSAQPGPGYLRLEAAPGAYLRRLT